MVTYQQVKYYSADVKAEQFQKWLSEITYGEGKRLSSANLHHINSDTTSVQPAFTDLISPCEVGIHLEKRQHCSTNIGTLLFCSK